MGWGIRRSYNLLGTPSYCLFLGIGIGVVGTLLLTDSKQATEFDAGRAFSG